MTYKRKELPIQLDGECDRDYVARVIELYPRGYMNMLVNHNVIHEVDALKYETRGERLYNWMYPNCRNTCMLCNAVTGFKQFSHGYYEYCSQSCRAKSNQSHLNGLTPEAIAKKKATYNAVPKSIREQSARQKYATRIENGKLPLSNAAAFAANRHPCLNDKKWLEEKYSANKCSITEIAQELSSTWELVKGALDRFDIPRHYHNVKTSVAERQLFEFVQTLTECHQSDRSIIKPQELDIVCPNQRVAIEYCGLYWHSSANPRQHANYHENKRIGCTAAGYKLLTIFEDEWADKRDIVKHRIKHAIGVTERKVYARNTIVKEVDISSAKHLIDESHTQGYKNAPIRYGLFTKDANELVAVMTLGVSRYDKTVDYEMIRFATKLGVAVIGGGSKLFQHFVKTHQPTAVVSYSDNRWGDGNFYNNLGFTRVSVTKPSYFYFKPGNLKRYHRSTFMKHKVVEMGGDPTLTEVENMLQFGYFRIFDCGTTKWLYVA